MSLDLFVSVAFMAFLGCWNAYVIGDVWHIRRWVKELTK
jgi:hypothetical protein